MSSQPKLNIQPCNVNRFGKQNNKGVTIYKVCGKSSIASTHWQKRYTLQEKKIIFDIFIVLYSHSSPISSLNRRLLIQRGLRRNDKVNLPELCLPCAFGGVWNSSVLVKFLTLDVHEWKIWPWTWHQKVWDLVCTLPFICYVTMNNAS